MAFKATWLGHDTVTRGDWTEPLGRLGYYVANSPSNVVSGEIRLNYANQAGGIDWARTTLPGPDDRAARLPGGGRSNAHYSMTDPRGHSYLVPPQSGPVLCSIYCVNFSALPSPLTVIASSSYWGVEPEDETPYTYPGDYQGGVWLRAVVASAARFFVILPPGMASQGVFVDPWPQGYVGLSQGYVGHGVY